MNERATAAGQFFGWSPAGVGRRRLPCARCGVLTAVHLLENLLEALCRACGRNLALERARALEEVQGPAALAGSLVALGALEQAEADAPPPGDGPLWERLAEAGWLRRDLRLVLELDLAAGAHAWGAAPLRELVLPGELEQALEARRAQGGLLSELLAEAVRQRLTASLRAAGRAAGVPVLAAGERPDPDVREALPRRALELFGAVPWRQGAEGLWVALWDPLDRATVEDLEALCRAPVSAFPAEPEALAAALRELGVEAPAREPEEPALDEEPEEEAPGGDPFAGVLLEALEEGAEEVVIEPWPAATSLRFRVRGEMRKARRLAPGLAAALAERLEALSGRVSEGPWRSGAARCEVSGLPLALRYRALETPLGPSLTLRLSEEARLAPGLPQLGLGHEALFRLESLLVRGQGLLLIASPPGGGRSSAARAVLERAVRLGGTVLALEEGGGPWLEGSTQLPLEALEGAGATLLRPAPDWLAIDGAVGAGAPAARAQVAASLAVDQALRGGCAILTVAAPDGESALARVEATGVAPGLLRRVLLAVLAGRVVDRNCPRCRVQRVGGALPMRRLGYDPTLIEALGPWVGIGCPACAEQGSAGQLPLAELLLPGPDGLWPAPGSQRLATRAAGGVSAGDLALEGVADLLGGPGGVRAG